MIFFHWKLFLESNKNEMSFFLSSLLFGFMKNHPIDWLPFSVSFCNKWLESRSRSLIYFSIRLSVWMAIFSWQSNLPHLRELSEHDTKTYFMREKIWNVIRIFFCFTFQRKLFEHTMELNVISIKFLYIYGVFQIRLWF